VKIVAAVAIALLFATPGIRLFRLRLRSGSGPEGWLSAFFLGLAIGIPLRLNLIGATDTSSALVQVLSGIALVSLITAASSLIIFTRRVFRPNSNIARVWTTLTVCCMSAVFPALFALGQLHSMIHPIAMAANLWALSAFVWTFVECINYYLRMRRQAQIGLGDPVVQNRFLLWSIWTGSFIVLPILSITSKVVLLADAAPGEAVVASAGLLNFIYATVLVCSASMLVAIWLSFFAPETYLARMRGSTTA